MNLSVERGTKQWNLIILEKYHTGLSEILKITIFPELDSDLSEGVYTHLIFYTVFFLSLLRRHAIVL